MNTFDKLQFIINEAPFAFTTLHNNSIEGSVFFYPYKQGILLVIEAEGLSMKPYTISIPNTSFSHSLLPTSTGDIWQILYTDTISSNQLITRTLLLQDMSDIRISKGKIVPLYEKQSIAH